MSRSVVLHMTEGVSSRRDWGKGTQPHVRHVLAAHYLFCGARRRWGAWTWNKRNCNFPWGRAEYGVANGDRMGVWKLHEAAPVGEGSGGVVKLG